MIIKPKVLDMMPAYAKSPDAASAAAPVAVPAAVPAAAANATGQSACSCNSVHVAATPGLPGLPGARPQTSNDLFKQAFAVFEREQQASLQDVFTVIIHSTGVGLSEYTRYIIVNLANGQVLNDISHSHQQFNYNISVCGAQVVFTPNHDGRLCNKPAQLTDVIRVPLVDTYVKQFIVHDECASSALLTIMVMKSRTPFAE